MKTERNPRREPWSIDESEFYELETRKDELEFLLRYAVLAPSGHNTQPWNFAIVEDGIEVFADYQRRLPQVDPDDRELLMSVGAAIMNLRIAAAHFGFDSTVLYRRSSSETEPVALVSLMETCNPDPALLHLFPAIMRRRTNRQPFDGEPIDPDALAPLCDIADEHPDSVQFLLPRDKVRIAQLVAQADRLQMSDRAIREELADWIRPARTSRSDGMCADSLGIPEILSSAAATVLRRLNPGNFQARRDVEMVRTTPLMILITAEDDDVSLLQAGQVLERLLLTATLAGLQYSFMNQPLQVATLRHLFTPIARSRRPPQLLVRIGYAHALTKAMPRREIADVIRTR